jgi:hypothetical protein
VTDEYPAVLRGPLPAAAPAGQAWQPGLDGGVIAAALAERITAERATAKRVT